jgi:hypothetical protein
VERSLNEHCVLEEFTNTGYKPNVTSQNHYGQLCNPLIVNQFKTNRLNFASAFPQKTAPEGKLSLQCFDLSNNPPCSLHSAFDCPTLRFNYGTGVDRRKSRNHTKHLRWFAISAETLL